jgi:adenosine deaminase
MMSTPLPKALELSGLRTFIADLPKVELHRHLPGSLRLETIIDLAHEYQFDLPTDDPQELKRYVQVTPGTPADLAYILRTVSAFLRRFFVSREAIARIAFEMVEDAWREGVIYLEVRFSPWYMATEHGLSLDDVVAGVADGLEAARARYPIHTAMLIGMTREAGLEACSRAANLALAQREVVGVDLSGDEQSHPARQFKSVFERIRRDGRLGITVHAGEASGPESVRDAIEYLGAHRIGHGVRVIHDPQVVELVRSRGVTLETCPTSNVLTGAVLSLADHPLRELLTAGVAATINTDDPSWFDTTLTGEYCLALAQLGLSFSELRQAVINAARGAFLPAAEREALVIVLREAYAAAEGRFVGLNLTSG